jgi:phage tail-like protein
MAAAPVDPIVANSFALEVTGITAFFREISGFSNSSEVVEHKQQGKSGVTEYIKQPGNLSWDNIVLKRGIIADDSLWKWRKDVIDGQITKARKDGTITGYDEKGEIKIQYSFKRAWPAKWSASDLNAGGNDVIMETLELAVESLDRTK